MKKNFAFLALGALFYVIGILTQFYLENINLSLAFYILSYLIVGHRVLYSAVLSISRGAIFSEFFLMSLATLGAFFLGEYPEAVAVMLFYRIGEIFEDYAVGKSRKSITDIMAIRPDLAHVKRENGVESVNPGEVKIGEIIIVHAGERIPLDGVVCSGRANLDTSALTGEALPQAVSENEEILSGTLNLDGVLEITVTKAFSDSTVNRILDMVEMASMRKSKKEQFITRFARYYTPVVVIGAVLLALVPNFFTGFMMWEEWLYRALVFLVVSCPCALVVSIPLSFFGGIGGASKKGILVKGSNYLEALAELDTLVFDKTGTLTKGELKVSEVLAKNCSKEDLLAFAGAMEVHSKHPLALALVEYCQKEEAFKQVTNLVELSGRGLSGEVDGQKVLCGNALLMRENQVEDFADNCRDTAIHIAVEGRYYGSITFTDTLKEEASSALNTLKKLGVGTLVLLTGDKLSVAEDLKKTLPLDEVYGNLLPTDKLAHVERMLGQKSSGTLGFVGDGINDAPVLARADVGIAMGAMGSDAAIEASDVVIMDDNLTRLAQGIAIARKTVTIAKQNIVFAIGVKVGVLILSVFGLANLWMGVFADVGVTVLAILNAFRSLYQK